MPFAVLLVFAAAAGTASAEELVIRSKRVEAAPAGPEAPEWARAEAVTVPLVPQGFVAPRGGGGTRTVEIRSLQALGEIFFLLAWEDKTRSAGLGTGGGFTDACAVAFPLAGGAMPSPFMGEKGGPVNIWMWRAVAGEPGRYPAAYADFHRSGAVESHVKFPDRPVQSLLAEGFGTLGMNGVQDVEGTGVWRDGRWRVMLRRGLGSKSGTAFKDGSSGPVAFAVWDGGVQERDGAKSLSLWHSLSLGEGKVPEPGTDVEKGRRVFARYGCATCHGPAGKGGIKNPNSQGGEVPPIHRVKEGYSEEELKAVIREGRDSGPEDPKGPPPPLRMYAWKNVMSEPELESLVKYLFSLMPKGKEDTW